MLMKLLLTADSLLLNGWDTQTDNIYLKHEDREVRKFIAPQMLDSICRALQAAAA
jgi:hypothetical protein